MALPLPKNAELLCQTQNIKLWQWPQTLFDGSVAVFDCATRPDSVEIIPFIDEHTVLLTKQEQPQKQEMFFAFPGGRVDADEDLEIAAKRELLEETGSTVSKILSWHRSPINGVVRFEEELFIGMLSKTKHPTHLDPGEKIELMPTSWNDLVQMCLKNQLRSKSAMLAVLQMEFDPASKERLHTWLRGT